jgi:LCP family protein required for cell wall assembly
MALDPRVRRYLLRGLAALGVLVVLWAGFSAFRIWRAWSNVERVSFDTETARVAIDAPGNPFLGQDEPPDPADADPDDTESTTDLDEEDGPPPDAEVLNPDYEAPVAPTIDRSTLNAFLIMGSDQRPQFGTSQRADVILLFILPADGTDPILMSIPRDLYLTNPCTGRNSRINATLNGCGDRATGPELLGIAVEDFTGISIDHFAVIDFEGFKKVIDRVGGVEICVDHQVRDPKPKPPLDLPAGCSIADGDQALAWVRSRRTEELVDGVWRRMDGVNDLTRNQRQQDLLMQALTKLKGFRSITEFSALVEDIADAFIIDEDLSLGGAIGIAWDLRDLQPSQIQRVEIPVSYYVTEDGAYVLLPQGTFAEIVEDAWPGVAEAVASGA